MQSTENKFTKTFILFLLSNGLCLGHYGVLLVVWFPLKLPLNFIPDAICHAQRFAKERPTERWRCSGRQRLADCSGFVGLRASSCSCKRIVNCQLAGTALPRGTWCYYGSRRTNTTFIVLDVTMEYRPTRPGVRRSKTTQNTVTKDHWRDFFKFNQLLTGAMRARCRF